MQQPSDGPVVFQFKGFQGRRYIPGKTKQACQLISLPKISDDRGSLSFIEGQRHLPFKIQSAYWLNGMSNQTMAGDNAYCGLDEFIIAVSDHVEVMVDNGREEKRYLLNRPDCGLYVPTMIWRRIETCSVNTVVLILTSQPHQNENHIPGLNEQKEIGVWW